uniref:PAN-1 domain and Apple-like domain-containing protein n=1 Tax=Parastrongyloides trichosuri TaxID=131310 RepID=A0A0N4Z1R8_PARTI
MYKNLLIILVIVSSIFGEDGVYEVHNKRRKYRRKPKYISENNLSIRNDVSYDDNIDKIVTEAADLSDPCFRRFSHTTVFNSQPFERKSDISMEECKEKCIQNIKESLLKLKEHMYNCKSVVYSSGICDLYNHPGDEAPALLLRFNNSHYFEPSMQGSCFKIKNNIEKHIELKEVPKRNNIPNSIEDQIINILYDPIKLGNSNNIRKKQSSIPNSGKIIKSVSTPKRLSMSNEKFKISRTCGKNKIERYLKVSGYELYNNNEIILENVSYEECSEICNLNEINNKPFKCRSFDLYESTCYLSSETAVPLGNGQLKKNISSNYFEKMCVNKEILDGCPNFFERYPQKIIVGFAEMVIDVRSFEECFNMCLNSNKLFNFTCLSGMFYFEESNLNCILNTENKNTQPELFTDELHDIVDYFETGCIIDKEMKGSIKENIFQSKDILKNNENIQPKRDMDEGTILIPSSSRDINKELWKNLNPKWTVVQ